MNEQNLNDKTFMNGKYVFSYLFRHFNRILKKFSVEIIIIFQSICTSRSNEARFHLPLFSFFPFLQHHVGSLPDVRIFFGRSNFELDGVTFLGKPTLNIRNIVAKLVFNQSISWRIAWHHGDSSNQHVVIFAIGTFAKSVLEDNSGSLHKIVSIGSRRGSINFYSVTNVGNVTSLNDRNFVADLVIHQSIANPGRVLWQLGDFSNESLRRLGFGTGQEFTKCAKDSTA